MLQAEDQNIEKLFEKSAYSIPDYQRGYSWKKEQVIDLIDDIQDAIDMESGFYFLSTVTICLEVDDDKVQEDGKKDGPEFVIDGQQRIITLSLIMHFLSSQLKGGETRSKLDQCLFIEDDALRVTLKNRDDKKVFEKVLLNKDVKTESKLNISLARKEIEEHSSFDNKEKCRKFAKFLLESVVIIKNTVLNEECACQIFESLNDRGVYLTAFDLIKNRLFLISDDKKETDKKLDGIQQNIKGALGNGRSLSANTRNYFRFYLQVHYESFIEDGNMYKKFKEFSEKGRKSDQSFSNNFLEELSSDQNRNAFLSVISKDLGYASIKQKIKKLERLDHLKHYFNNVHKLKICQPILFALFYHMNIKNLENTLKDLYCLITRTRLSGKRLSKHQDILASIAYEMYHNKNKKFSNLLKDKIEQDGLSKFTQQKFKSHLKGLPEIDLKLAKDLLFDICLLSLKSTMQTIQRLYRKSSLEHILPKEFIQKDYPGITSDEHKLYVNNLGNLTILETKDNSSNSNKSIEEKLKMFNSKKYANFPVVNDIKSYLETKKSWTIEIIRERRERLADQYVKLVKFSWEK